MIYNIDKENNIFYKYRELIKKLDAENDAKGNHMDWTTLVSVFIAENRKLFEGIKSKDLDDMQHAFVQWANGKTWEEIMA